MSNAIKERVAKIIQAIELLGKDCFNAEERASEYFETAKRLAHEVVQLRAMLKRCEWKGKGILPNGMWVEICPICEGLPEYHHKGHLPDCELAALLKETNE